MPVTQTIKRNLKVVILLINIILAVITIVAAYGGKINPETTTIPAILAMTFPGWVILTIITLIIDLWLFRRISAIPVITLIVCLTPILSFSPLNFSSVKLTPEQEKKSFTLMSYNVFGLIDFNDLYAIFPHRTGVSGENVYSRFPLYPIDLRQPESEYCWFGAAMVHIMGHKTLVISVHFQSIGLNREDKALFHQLTEGDGTTKVKEVKQQLLGKLSNAFRERATQARLLREQIDSLNVENVIIAGDFNDIPDCYALRILAQEDFKSAFSIAGCGPTYTYHANRFFFNIDHVLYRGKMHAVSYDRQKEGNSDHYPLEVKFIWKD